MRKLFLISILLLFALQIKAQDSTITVNNYYRGTLTASKDTVKISFNSFAQSGKYVTIIAYHTTSADTIYVDTKTRSVTNQTWTNKLLYNLSDGTTSNYIVTTTTPVEYVVIDPEASIIRLRTPDVTVSTVYIAQVKNGLLSAVFTGLPAGGATSANQSTQINYASPFTSSSGTLTTVSTEVDTTVFTATKWQTFGVFALNDTLEISLSGSFTDAKMVLPYTEYTFEHFSPTTFPKGFIRRYGSVGTVSYIPTIIGF